MRIFFSKLKGKNDIIGAEIGVLRGDNAASVLGSLCLAKFYLIDSWKVYTGDDLDIVESKAGKGNEDFIKDCKISTYNRFNNYKNVEIICKESIEAAKDIPDNSLDFAYIDAKHTFQHVFNDCNTWYPKVKEGGMLGGHDIFHSFYGKEVQSAVAKFCIGIGRNNYLFGGDDWWIIK